jgi:hypothetical protein
MHYISSDVDCLALKGDRRTVQESSAEAGVVTAPLPIGRASENTAGFA